MNKFIYQFIFTFILTICLLVFFIPFFRKIKVSQSIRKEGPRAHYKKSGTPTMGGIFIILSTIICFSIYFFEKNKYDLDKYILLMYPLIVYSLIGFLDDGLIVIKRNNKGIKPRIKLILQIAFAILYFVLYYYLVGDTTLNLFGFIIDLKIFYGVLVVFMIVASSNAVNLTDGLDGLASGVLVIVLVSIAILGYRKDIDITIFSISLIGSLIGFLCYNFHPAKLFMGDVGSLSLGAVIASLFILLKMEVLLIAFGLMFIVETVSVMLQVYYFRRTNGKRLFLMTPIHHHLELKGLKEWQIDLLFWIISLIMATIGLYLGNKFF